MKYADIESPHILVQKGGLESGKLATLWFQIKNKPNSVNVANITNSLIA